MTSDFWKRRTGILTSCALLAVFMLVAAGAARWGRDSDGPRIAGLWDVRGSALVIVTGLFLLGAGLVRSAVPAQRRRRAFGIVAAILAQGCVFAVLELCAVFRFVDYRLIFPSAFIKPWQNPRNILDRELMYKHRPHEKFIGSVPGDLTAWYGIQTDRRYDVDFRYDHRGFRNRADREQANVVLIGDSKVEGSLVPYEQIASSRLESLLQTSVLNLGQIGYGPQQCGIVLRRYGLPASPKVVVWMLFEGNDLTIDFDNYNHAMSDFDGFVRQVHGLRNRCFTRNLFLALARWTTPPLPESAERGLGRSCLLTKGPQAGERLYFAYEPLQLTAETRNKLRSPLQFVLEGSQSCASAGIRFLFVFVPIKYRVYHDLCTIELGTEAAGWKPQDLPGYMADWAHAAHNIDFLDLTPQLRFRAAAGELVYYLDDGHWTSVGHDVAAAQIAEVIGNRNWLKNLHPVE